MARETERFKNAFSAVFSVRLHLSGTVRAMLLKMYSAGRLLITCTY